MVGTRGVQTKWKPQISIPKNTQFDQVNKMQIIVLQEQKSGLKGHTDR
jgi:hypothetical protein